MCIAVANKIVIGLCAKRDRICINMTGQTVVFALFIYFYQYLKYGKNLGEILCVIGTIGSLPGTYLRLPFYLISLETGLETGLFY